MKPLKNLNILSILKDYDDFTTKKAKSFNIAKYYSKKSFIPHCLALFATVPLIRNDNELISITKTISNTKISEEHYASPDLTIKSEIIRGLIAICAEANRSLLMDPSHPHKYKAFTPLFMYAHKLYNNVQYSEWDKNDKRIRYALGRSLYNMHEFALKHEKPILSQKEVKEVRAEGMTFKSGNKEGTQEAATSYKMISLDVEGIKYPADILRVELQTWIANVELRDPSAMILDIWDWDRIPESLDVYIKPEPTIPVDPGRKSTLFDLL